MMRQRFHLTHGSSSCEGRNASARPTVYEVEKVWPGAAMVLYGTLVLGVFAGILRPSANLGLRQEQDRVVVFLNAYISDSIDI